MIMESITGISIETLKEDLRNLLNSDFSDDLLLNDAYNLHVLNTLCPAYELNLPYVPERGPKLSFCFDTGLSHLAKLYDWYEKKNLQAHYAETASLNEENFKPLYLSALNEIEKFDSYYLKLYNLLVQRVYFAQFYDTESGSNLHAPGILLISPKAENRNKYYIAELIIHETLHQLLNADEFMNTAYSNEEVITYTDKLGFTGAISGKHFPMRVAFQSMFVVLSGIAYYQSLKNETIPFVDKRLKALLNSFNIGYQNFCSIVEQHGEENLFSERGLRHFRHLQVQANKPEFKIG